MNPTTHKKLQIGDVFQVALDESANKYFQYIATDQTQLGSQVIRVFSDKHDAQKSVDINGLVVGKIDFHAHVFLNNGIKQQYWQKIGHSDNIAKLDILFRDTNDYGKPSIKISQNWHVWKINEPFEKIGKLTAVFQQAEIGVVVPPDSLLHRIQNGIYDFNYPGY